VGTITNTFKNHNTENNSRRQTCCRQRKGFILKN